VVAQIDPDTPAAKAGVKQGDVILKVNGQQVDSANALRLRISQTPPGSTVKLEVSRDGKVQDIDVTLGTLPEGTADNAAPAQQTQPNSGGLKGVQVQALTSDLAQRMQVPSGVHGVVITSVDPDSTAAAANLDRGSVIEEINHKPITSVDSYRQAISAAGNQPMLMLVYAPDRGPGYVVVQPDQP
jgi:serine protease Do